MITETIQISDNATLKTYLWDDSEELAIASRPAVLVFPGGAYMYCSDREAEPVAYAYLAEGFNTFVLRYTTEKTFAPAFEEACRALNLIRKRAAEWHVASDRIAVCGFSAGGHLACAMGVLAEQKANAMVLGYPAVIGKDWESVSSEIPDLIELVGDDAAPAFITACTDDMVVPVNNSIRLMDALNQHGIPFESHIFHRGDHGFSLAKECTAGENPAMINPAVSTWFSMSVTWLKAVMGDVIMKEKPSIPEGFSPAVYRPVRELMEDSETREIFLRYFPDFSEQEHLISIFGNEQICNLPFSMRLSPNEMAAFSDELKL